MGAGKFGQAAELLEQGGHESVERVARTEHETGDPLLALEQQQLGKRSAGVVAGHDEVVQIVSLDELADEPGHAARAEVGIVGHRDGVRAQRPVRGEAPRLGDERRHDLSPREVVMNTPWTQSRVGPAPSSRYRIVPADNVISCMTNPYPILPFRITVASWSRLLTPSLAQAR